ncbi:MAG: TadE/TadG family type IV pilus assembly protein [Acetobacterales bacterium]
MAHIVRDRSSRPFGGRFAARLLRNRRGGASLEFALILPMFLLLSTAVLEMGVMLFVDTVLDGAAADAARRIRTGEAQLSADPTATFRSRLCDSLYVMVDCERVWIDVRPFGSFAAVVAPLQFDEDGEPVDLAFTPGGSGQITLVRALYRWEFLTPIVGRVLGSDGSNALLLVSTNVFRNEPYEL